MCEAIGIIPDVIAIGKEVSNKQFEIKCTLELYNSMLVNKILFNCQSWSHLKKTELKDLEKVQLQTLKQIMRVPYSTSNAGTYLELGILPLRYIIQKRRLAFLHHILTLDNEDPVYMNYVLQRNSSNQNIWTNEVARIRSQYSLHQSDEEIKLLSKNKWKSIVVDHVEKYVYSLLCDQTSLQSKTKFITLIFSGLKIGKVFKSNT